MFSSLARTDADVDQSLALAAAFSSSDTESMRGTHRAGHFRDAAQAAKARVTGHVFPRMPGEDQSEAHWVNSLPL